MEVEILVCPNEVRVPTMLSQTAYETEREERCLVNGRTHVRSLFEPRRLHPNLGLGIRQGTQSSTTTCGPRVWIMTKYPASWGCSSVPQQCVESYLSPNMVQFCSGSLASGSQCTTATCSECCFLLLGRVTHPVDGDMVSSHLVAVASGSGLEMPECGLWPF